MLAACQYSASINWTAGEEITNGDCKWTDIWTGSASERVFKQISTSEGNNLTDNYISSHRTTEISDKLLLLIIIIIIIISESKVHPVTCHEGPYGK